MMPSATGMGLITGLLMVAVHALFFGVLKKPYNGPQIILIWLVYAAGIVISILGNSKKLPIKSPGKLFQIGFKTFITATLIMTVYIFIFFKLNPQIINELIETNNALLLKTGKKTVAEIDENASQMRKSFIPIMLTTTIFINVVIGVIISIITSFLTSVYGSKTK